MLRMVNKRSIFVESPVSIWIVFVELLVFQNCDSVYGGTEVNNKNLTFDNKNCLIKDQITNYTLDLSIFTVDEKPFYIPDTIVLGFNVCHKVADGCGVNQNASACLRRAGKNHTLGSDGETKFELDNGKLSFKFLKGENCSDNKLYSLTLSIGCGIGNKTKYSYISEKSDNCSFVVSSESSHACFPSPATPSTPAPPSPTPAPTSPTPKPTPKKVEYTNCVAKDSSNIKYNLNQLQFRTHKNVITRDWNFTVRICSHDEVQIPNCPPGTNICLNNGTNNLSFGKTANLTYDKNLKLNMKFDSGVKCKDDVNYTSTIMFKCSTGEGKPEVTKNGCSFIFEWETIHACNPKPCESVHPQTGFRFNMNTLKTKFNSTAEQGKVYNFAICKSPGTPCLENDGYGCGDAPLERN